MQSGIWNWAYMSKLIYHRKFLGNNFIGNGIGCCGENWNRRSTKSKQKGMKKEKNINENYDETPDSQTIGMVSM